MVLGRSNVFGCDGCRSGTFKLGCGGRTGTHVGHKVGEGAALAGLDGDGRLQLGMDDAAGHEAGFAPLPVSNMRHLQYPELLPNKLLACGGRPKSVIRSW